MFLMLSLAVVPFMPPSWPARTSLNEKEGGGRRYDALLFTGTCVQVPDLDDLIFLFFGGIYETRGRSATCSGFASRFFLFITDNIHIRYVPQYLYLSRVFSTGRGLLESGK